MDRQMNRPSHRDGWTHLFDFLESPIYHVEIVLGNVASENSERVVFREHDQKNVTNIVGLSINIRLVLSHFALF